MIVGIGNLKRIDDDAVFSRHNLGIQNLQTASRHDSGDFRKQPGDQIIMRNHHIFACPELRIEIGIDHYSADLQSTDRGEVRGNAPGRGPINIA